MLHRFATWMHRFVMRCARGGLGRFEDDGFVAYFGAEDIREHDGISDGATHTQDDVAFVDGEVDHEGCCARGGAGAIVFGDGVDFLHQLYGALGVVEVGEVEADDVLWFVRDMLDGCWWRRRFGLCAVACAGANDVTGVRLR